MHKYALKAPIILCTCTKQDLLNDTHRHTLPRLFHFASKGNHVSLLIYLSSPATPDGNATSLSSGEIHLLGTTVTGSA